ncbi:MAG: hypothetical protein JNL11_18580 [Bdellovibrionaceae bacterium]|nr:hypothetical protein [Pseudobdellovibrionaceae bacterium]
MRNFLIACTISITVSLTWGADKKKLASAEPLLKTSVQKPSNESRLRLMLRSNGYETQFEKADVFQFRVNYYLKYFVNPSIYLKVNPIARLNSGHVQSVNGAESLANRISIQNAGAYYEWMKESYLGIGILDQYEVFSALLIDDQIAFVAGQAKQSHVTGPWTFSAFSQSAIPNTESSTTDQNGKESTPMLTSVGVSSTWSPNERNTTHAKASYFKYSQIPTSVSTASVIGGNTSADFRISETQRAFKYEYYGLDTEINFRRHLHKSAYLLGSASFLENQGAPKGINQGYRYGGGAGINILTHNELELSGYSFRIESDAALASYANTDYFRTNHLGYEFLASWKNVKQNFRVSFAFVDLRLIVENPAQSDGKIYFLRFEVLNVPI